MGHNNKLSQQSNSAQGKRILRIRACLFFKTANKFIRSIKKRILLDLLQKFITSNFKSPEIQIESLNRFFIQVSHEIYTSNLEKYLTARVPFWKTLRVSAFDEGRVEKNYRGWRRRCDIVAHLHAL